MIRKSGILLAVVAAVALVAAFACTREVVKEVEVPQIVTETVVKEVTGRGGERGRGGEERYRLRWWSRKRW